MNFDIAFLWRKLTLSTLTEDLNTPETEILRSIFPRKKATKHSIKAISLDISQKRACSNIWSRFQ